MELWEEEREMNWWKERGRRGDDFLILDFGFWIFEFSFFGQNMKIIEIERHFYLVFFVVWVYAAVTVTHPLQNQILFIFLHLILSLSLVFNKRKLDYSSK